MPEIILNNLYVFTLGYFALGFILGSLAVYFDSAEHDDGFFIVLIFSVAWPIVSTLYAVFLLGAVWERKLSEWGRARRIRRAERKWRKANEYK